MNSDEILQSIDTTAIAVIQLLENSQPQVLTHEYLYTSVITEAILILPCPHMFPQKMWWGRGIRKWKHSTEFFFNCSEGVYFS